MVSATFKAEAKPDPSRLTEKYHAVQLQGQGLDAKTLSKMQGKGLPFYVQGANNKVWFFDTKDSKKYTYTDEMESSDARFIREFFAQPSQDAVESWQAAARHGGSDAAGEAERLAGQTAVRQSSTSTGNSLVQKLAKGTRSFFGKALRP
ncbi:hypothetical protein [Sporisorium scitamineum]|nr:hypothetical protein [Sporisorium scitamineum]